MAYSGKIILPCVFFWFTAFIGVSEASTEVVLQLKWYHQFQFAGYYAAVEKGYYREAGLDVILQEGHPHLDMARELTSGRADFLVSGPGLLLETEDRDSVVVLAAIFQHSPIVLIARPPIRIPADILGKRIMFEARTEPEFLAMCHNEGIAPENIVPVVPTWNPEDLIRGQADAMSAYLTNEPYYFKKRNIPVNIIRPLNYGVDFYGDCLFTTRHQIALHPARVRAFRQASLKGWQYAMEHPEEIIELLVRKYSVRKDRDYLRYEAGIMHELILPELVPVGHMNEGRWRNIVMTYTQLDLMPSGFQLKKFLYDPAYNPASGWIRWFTGILSFGFLAVAVWSLVLLNFNRKLKTAVDERTRTLSRFNEELNAEIADRKRAEKQLKKYETMVCSSSDFMALVDRNYIYQAVNAVYQKAFGKPVEEIAGRHVREIYGDSFEKDIKPRLDQCMTGEEVRFKIWLHTPGMGKIYRSEAYYPIVEPDGTISGVVSIGRNITRIKSLEDQLYQAQKMEAIGTLAGGVAHDFNNLLMGIQGRTSLMLEDGGISAYHLEHLREIEGYVESAVELTRQLLKFAKGGECEVRPTDLNELLRHENRMFGRTRKEVVINEAFEPDLWGVEVDRGQMRQVFLNLYINAWQAMPDGGHIYSRTENVILDAAQVQPFDLGPGKYVKICVTDTGIGMDEQTRQRIFEPFFTTREKNRGTGLGLASVYGIIKRHNGFVTVYSEKGEGTTFNIFLPASEKTGSAQTPEKSRIVRGKERILLVDDETIILDVGREMLEWLGYDVRIAKNGDKAIRMYEKERVDLVILDMLMPEMGGAETFERLRAVDPSVRVLLASGYSVNGKATEILQKGCNGFIQKPFNMKELSRKLREVLDEKPECS